MGLWARLTAGRKNWGRKRKTIERGGMLDGFTSGESHPNHPHQGGLEDMRLGRHQPGKNDNNGLEKILKVNAKFNFISPANAQVKAWKILCFSRL